MKLIKQGAFADSEKALLCGFLAGDGSVKKRKEGNNIHYEIGFYPDDELMLKSYCNAIFYLYSKQPLVKKKDNFYSVRISSKTIYEDLIFYGKFDTCDWSIPDAILQNEPMLVNWLKGFYSAEAYVTPKVIRVQTINLEGMKQVSRALHHLNIENKYYEYSPKKANHNRVGIVIISKKSARESFLRHIGFSHSAKTTGLVKALDL